MALFVAKLLDAQLPRVENHEELNERSPVNHRVREREPFELKLSRALKRREVRTRYHISDAFKKTLSELLLNPPLSGTIKHGWPPAVIELLQNLPCDPHADLEHALQINSGQISSLLHSAQEERKRAEQEENQKRLILISKAVHALTQAQKEKLCISELSQDIGEIEIELSLNQATIKKGRFLEAVISCIGLTDELNAIQSQKFLEEGDSFISKLIEIEAMKSSLSGRCREVIESRFEVLTHKFTQHLVKVLEGGREGRNTAYRLLSQFGHADTFKVITLYLTKALEKFHFHFVRKVSELNLVDKPEWPLRWFVDTAVETCNQLQDKDHVATFVAMKAREYYRENRWVLIESIDDPDDAELFSLYLAKYIHSAMQWKDIFGMKVLSEFMLDIISSTSFGKWNLLDAWIMHDKRHMEAALRATNNPYSVSVHDPLACNIVVTLEDIFNSSKARLGCLQEASCLEYFISACHDPVCEDFVYDSKVAVRSMGQKEKDRFRHSLDSLLKRTEESNAFSAYSRKQIADLIRHI